MLAKVSEDTESFADKLRRSMRSSAIGVSLVTACDVDGSKHGMAVTSATSLSMEPPSMMVAINRSASSHPVIGRTGRFCLNMIHTGQADILDLFCRSDKRAVRFDSDEWKSGHGGLPYLDTAIASLFCRVEEAHDFGTHTVFFGLIEDIRTLPGGYLADPLIWINGAPARLSADQSPAAAS